MKIAVPRGLVGLPGAILIWPDIGPVIEFLLFESGIRVLRQGDNTVLCEIEEDEAVEIAVADVLLGVSDNWEVTCKQ